MSRFVFCAMACACLTALACGTTRAASASTVTDENGRIRAQLVSQHDVVISSQVEGNISHLNLKEGDAFEAGQLLVGFDCKLYEAQLQKAEAAAEAAHKAFEVNKQLGTLRSVGELDVEQAKAKAKESDAEVAFIRTTVDRCRIAAPFAGRVAKRIAAQYEYVGAGKPLLEVVDTGSPDLKLIVPSVWLSWLRSGATLQVHMDDLNADYAASVVRIGARVDPVSQTIEVNARIKGSHPELLPGMSGWARFAERR